MASVAEIIRRYQVEIVAEWTAKARTVASARGLTGPTFTNLMPLFLGSLGDGVGSTLEAAVRRRGHVLGHLAARIRQGFDLSEMVGEFNLLERCIVRVCLSLPAEDRPAEADIDRMRDGIQEAVMQLSDAFFRHMLEDEQTEKRYLRLLQDIANEALHDDRRPLRERLHEVLGVVVDAMGAQCAALLLFEVGSERLVTVSSFGDPVLEAYATSLDPGSFAGKVAGSQTAMSIRDVTTTPLDVPEKLRDSGIHSMLGVRVPPLSQLHGVLYIGLPETREFTRREIYRLELLAERLALHLENARLVADLHDTISSLHAERGVRERFVAALAHDLRGPLTAARLSAGMLVEPPAELHQRVDLATRIERNIDRVDRMIRDLLDANRIHAGEPLPLRLDACELRVLVDQVAEEARAQFGERFVVDCDDVRGVWSVDELHRALWNLVTNAVKYGAAEQPITIRGKATRDAVRLSVHNFGVPIRSGELSSLFHAFHRSAEAETGGQLGWGLGLTLVRGCAEAHGGHADVVSDATGTTFSMELPIDSRAFQHEQQSARSATIH